MKKKHIALTVFLILAIAIASFAYLSRNHLFAIRQGLTMTSEDLEKERVQTDEKARETVKEYGIENIRSLTEQEAEMLSNGEITEEDAINLVLGKKMPEELVSVQPPAEQKENSDSETTNTTETPEKNDDSEVPENNKNDDTEKNNARIAQLIGKMYVLKSQFTGELGSIEAWAKSEYIKLSPEEKKSTSAKMKIGSQALSKALSLEKSCNAQVDEILGELNILLEETGQSTKLVSEIRSAYENEKQLTKSYYISKFQG